MDSFVKRVRNGDVSQPTQRSFTEAHWQEEFASVATRSPDDRDLYRTGLWAFNKLEAIRGKLIGLWPEGIGKDYLLRMYAAGANRNFQILLQMHPGLEKDEVLISEQIVQSKIPSSHTLEPARPDSLLLSSIDGLRFPIQKAYSAANVRDIPKLNDEETISRIISTSLLGQIYDTIEAYWMTALWNGWFVETMKNSDVDLIRPPATLLPLMSAISLYRREALMLEASFHFHREWKNLLTETTRTALISELPRIDLKEQVGSRKYIVSVRQGEDSGSMMMLQNRIQAERGYYVPLLDQPLDHLVPITLHMLLKAWEVLYALAESLLGTLPNPKDSGVYSVEKLLKYAPVISRQELARLLQEWCGFPAAIADRTVEFFSYGKGSRWELWGHPLIKTKDDLLIVLLAPILLGNFERTFELWMKDGGVRIADKGPLFEAHCRAQLAQSLKQCRHLRSTSVYPTSLVLKEGEVEEEIDLVIRIKNTVLLGEVKCLIFPCDPIEFSRHFGRLSEAADQITRKVEFAKRHKDLLLKQLGFEEAIEIEQLSIHPFVFINQPYGAGFSLDGVPIVDEFILDRYFEGVWYRMVSVTDTVGSEAESTFLLYQSEDEASRNIGEYLSDPPQLRHYREFLNTRLQKYPRIDQKDRPFAAAVLEVVLPLPDLTYASDLAS